MHIENTLRLDFKDVLIRPKRSTLTSRSEVDITREFKFRHSPIRYKAIPIIAANMDTTGTFEIARALGRHDLSTALCKHYAVDEYVAFFSELEAKHTAFYSLGITEADWEKFLIVR
jgi:GMP reductase